MMKETPELPRKSLNPLTRTPSAKRNKKNEKNVYYP
jgi:hypothetical protein